MDYPKQHKQYAPNLKTQFPPITTPTDDFESSPAKIRTYKTVFVGDKVSLGPDYVGVYTPTIGDENNISATTAYECQFIRLGDFVLVSGRVDVDPVNPAASTQVGLSLPINRALTPHFTAANQAAGTAFCPDIAGMGAAIHASTDINNDTPVTIRWLSSDINNNALYFTFMYRLI